MIRPGGLIKIEKTEVKARGVLVAKLSGAVNGEAAVVRHKGENYFVAPGILDEPKKVESGSLTDCLHESMLWVEDWAKGKGKAKEKK